MSQRDLHRGEEFRRVLSEALYFEMRDPGMEGVSITHVKVSPDLQFADIRFTLPDDLDPNRALTALGKGSGAFKRILTKHLKMRRVPSLRWHLDQDQLAEDRIGSILETLNIPPEEPTEDNEA